MTNLPQVEGERAWQAADRAAGAEGLGGEGEAYWARVREPGPVWAEITEAAYWEALEALPPIYFPGGFAVSEAMTDGPTGTV